jgi:hypothetical protein
LRGGCWVRREKEKGGREEKGKEGGKEDERRERPALQALNVGFGGNTPSSGGMISMRENHGSLITSSVVALVFGSGSSILLRILLHSRGTRFESGGGVEPEVR